MTSGHIDEDHQKIIKALAATGKGFFFYPKGNAKNDGSGFLFRWTTISFWFLLHFLAIKAKATYKTA
jgi:hypothetical protein